MEAVSQGRGLRYRSSMREIAPLLRSQGSIGEPGFAVSLPQAARGNSTLPLDFPGTTDHHGLHFLRQDNECSQMFIACGKRVTYEESIANGSSSLVYCKMTVGLCVRVSIYRNVVSKLSSASSCRSLGARVRADGSKPTLCGGYSPLEQVA